MNAARTPPRQFRTTLAACALLFACSFGARAQSGESATPTSRAEAAAELVRGLRALLEPHPGRWRFTVTVVGAPQSGFSGEMQRPRWPLARDMLTSFSGESIYERLTLRGVAGGARAVARSSTDPDEYLAVLPESPLPDAFELPRSIIEACIIGLSSPTDSAEIDALHARLPLDAFLTDHLARRALAGRVRTDFRPQEGTIRCERKGEEWVFEGELRGTEVGAGKSMTVTVSLTLDHSDGIIIDSLPVGAAAALVMSMPRPGEARPATRVLDHYARERNRVETTLWLWFSDRDGGLGGAGALYDFQVIAHRWRDRQGREVAATISGPLPDDQQGGKLLFDFVDLEKNKVDRLELELELTINLYPVKITAAWSRGGDRHEGETAWMPCAPIVTEIGELPRGVKPVVSR